MSEQPPNVTQNTPEKTLAAPVQVPLTDANEAVDLKMLLARMDKLIKVLSDHLPK